MQACGWRIVLVLLLSLPLAARTATAGPITTLAVTVISPAAIDAPMVVGIARGIFEKYGLKIQMSTVANGFEALKQVADGTAQVGAGAATAVAQTMGQGARFKSIVVSNGDATGKVSTDSYVAVVARAASGIREGHLEDLRGKKIGVRRGSDFHQYLFSALAAKGLDPLSAVTIVSTSDLLGALRTGSVDAIVTSEPGASRILNSTSGAMLIQRGGNHMQFLELRVVSSHYLATHPGTIKRYITGFAEAAQFARTRPDETTDIMIQRQFKGLGRELVRAAVGFLDPDVRISKVTVLAAQAGSDFAMKIGALKQAPAFEAVFDIRILRQVEREHPEFFSDLPPIPEALQL
jgi:ABC-type nitrate/sulfonate/bicarbonate transport system substrate-binding protein